MARIEELKIGTAVRYRDVQGTTEGKIVGRRLHGRVEGDVDPDGYDHDRVKVAFPTIGVPPETPSVSCSPDAVEIIEEDRNRPVARACPHCGNLEAKLMPPLGDYSEYRCPVCGTYRISGTVESLIERGTVDPKSARIEERNGHRCLVQ